MARWLEAIPLSELLARPAPINAKKHDALGIRASVTRHGFVEAPTIDERTGRLVAGHGRLEDLAIRKANGEDAPDGIEVDEGTGEWLVPTQRGWASRSDKDASAYLVASNKLTEAGGWDDDLLAQMLGEYRDDADWLLGTGFDEQEVVSFLASVGGQEPENEGDPDDVPERPSIPVSQPGDIWLLGMHRLMCGDSTAESDVDRLMAGERAEMVFTDPPYGVDYDGGTKVREKLSGDDTTELFGPACLMAARCSTPDAPLYLWHAGVKGIAAAAAAAAAAAGYEIRCEIVWNKNQAQFGALGAQYKQKHEPCYYCFKKGQTVNWCGPTNEVTVWDVDRANVNEFHPTQKPVELVRRALRNHSARTVLDLFGGSGSTIIGAHQEARRAFVIELDHHYVDVIAARFQQATGIKPVLESTGEPHDFLS